MNSQKDKVVEKANLISRILLWESEFDEHFQTLFEQLPISSEYPITMIDGCSKNFDYNGDEFENSNFRIKLESQM